MNITNILNRRLGLVTIPNLQKVVTNLLETIGFANNTLPDSRPYKVYTALFYIEAAEDDPVVTVLENTLDETPVWSFADYFDLTTTGNIFVSGKTYVTVHSQGDDNATPTTYAMSISETTIIINIYDLPSGTQRTSLIGSGAIPCRIEIRVYN